jgi:predicted phage terminase large subunit-like protein
LGCLAEHAEAIVKNQITRLVVRQPPGTLKSMTWGVLFPSWVWLDYPQTKFLFATNEQRNASRDAVFCRKLVNSRWYQESFNPDWRLADDQDQKLYFQTTRGGHRLCVTTGGSTGGKKGNILIADDIHDSVLAQSKTVRDSDKSWFRLGFSDRMVNFATGVIIYVGHAVHREDMGEELVAEGWPELRLSEQFEERRRKTFPVAIERGDPRPDASGKLVQPRIRTDPRAEGDWLRPERFGPKQREEVILLGSLYAYRAKHQQEPTARGGSMFDPDKPNRVSAYPVGTVAVRYWDTAASTEESACNTSGVLIGRTPEGRFIIIHEKRGKWNPADRNRIMRNEGLADMKRPGLTFRRLYWEKGTSDSGLERDQILARALAGIPCRADPARGNKIQRAEGLSSQWDAGNVDIIDDDWTHGYLTRMSEFPQSSDKDTTDATSGGFNRLVLSDDDPELYGTADESQTIMGNLPPGTWDATTQSDPYA